MNIQVSDQYDFLVTHTSVTLVFPSPKGTNGNWHSQKSKYNVFTSCC